MVIMNIDFKHGIPHFRFFRFLSSFDVYQSHVNLKKDPTALAWLKVLKKNVISSCAQTSKLHPILIFFFPRSFNTSEVLMSENCSRHEHFKDIQHTETIGI